MNKISIFIDDGMVMAAPFWGSIGYCGYWGYGCATKAQHEYVELVIKGKRSHLKKEK